MEGAQVAIVPVSHRILRNTFVVASVFSLIVGVTCALLERAGVGRDFVRVFGIGAVDVLLICLLAERWRPSRRTLLMFGAGSLLGAGYFLLNYANEKIYISVSGNLDYFYYFAQAVVVAPIFEEAILRRWMLLGAAKWIGWLGSALLVSVIFALTHRNILIFAFMFSLLLCFMAYRGVNTIDRAVFHGSHNLILQGLFLFYAN